MTTRDIITPTQRLTPIPVTPHKLPIDTDPIQGSISLPSIKMSSEPKFKVLKDLITANNTMSLRQITEPSLPDVLAFKKTLILTLGKCHHDDSDAGYSYIVEQLSDFQTRSKNPKAILPLRPEQPIKPTDSKDTIAYYNYIDTRKEFRLYKEYNGQVLDLIEEVFPKSLLLLKEEGYLPPGTAAITAIEHVESSVRDNLASREHLAKLIKAMPDRDYRPNNNGPRDYFAGVDADIRLAAKLGHKTDLPTVILFAQSTFTRAHKKSAGEIRTIDKAYRHKIRHADATDIAYVYNTFKLHYVEELKELSMNSQFDGNDGTANLATTNQGLEIAELKQQLALLANHTQDLATAMEDGDRSLRSSIPPSIETKRDPAVQAILDQNKALSAQVATLTNTISNGGLSTTNNNGFTTVKQKSKRTYDNSVCKQFNQYCSSCGVNLSHPSGSCGTKRANHNNDATFENQMGGNASKNHKWMKFRDPTTGSLLDHCVTAGTGT